MTGKKTRLPQDMDAFDEKTLLLCFGHDTVKAYLADGNTITEEDAIKTDATDVEYSDHEGSRSQGGTGADHHDKEHYARVFLNHVSKVLHSRYRKGQFQRLTVFVPNDMKNLVKKKMHTDVLHKSEFISGNLSKSSPLELVKRMSL